MKVITHTKPVTDLGNHLPPSYTSFVGNYGYGSYCGLIYVTEPDTQNIGATFVDSDLWEFDKNFTEEDLATAIQLGSSTDGDIICSLKNNPSKIYVLPKDSESILAFDNLVEVFSFYEENHQLNNFYFEPFYARECKQLSLAKIDNLLDISPIHEQFLKDHDYDMILGKKQPKYVIDKIGGWIKFDLVYKNTITISYQKTATSEHEKYINYFEQKING